jgi:hypothetical protein
MTPEQIEPLDLLRTHRRLASKSAQSIDWSNLTSLRHERAAFVYPRLSTHEQRERSVWSIERQRWLEELARLDGYQAPLTKEEIELLRQQPEYPGWYQNGQILVDERDLGISGTLGRQSRTGLDHLIALVEANRVESIYTVEISRLWRDKSLTGERSLRPSSTTEHQIDVDDALRFGRLCKEQGVILVLPHMRLNLVDRMHWRIYRTEAERAAEELELMQYRLGGARTMKARQGFHPGGPNVPVGFTLDTNQDSPTYQKLLPYPPHADVVREIFRRFVSSGGSSFDVVTWCRREAILFPLPPDDLIKAMKGRWSFSRREPQESGWSVSLNLVRSIVTNPKYIGWWIYKGEIVSKTNHPPIIDQSLFWEAVSLATNHQPQRRGKAASFPPSLLSGLLYCCNHEGDPRPLVSSSVRNRHWYACDRDYRYGLADHQCFSVTNYILERPITQFIVQQCSYPEHAEAVLGQLESEYQQVRALVGEQQRRRSHLRQEIATLEANSRTLLQSEHYTPERHAQLEAAVSQKQRQLHDLDSATQSVEPRLTHYQVERVRAFLSSMQQDWEKLSLELQREFLTRIALTKVLLRHNKDYIFCRLIWRSGQIQELMIRRPYVDERTPWTEEEETLLRGNYETAPVPKLLEILPKRTWSGITSHAALLGIERKPILNGGAGISKPRWEPWEEELLRQYYTATITREELKAALPHRHLDVIKHKAGRMGLRWVHRQPWEPNLRWIEVPEGTFDCVPNATGVLFDDGPCRPSPTERASRSSRRPSATDPGCSGQ